MFLKSDIPPLVLSDMNPEPASTTSDIPSTRSHRTVSEVSIEDDPFLKFLRKRPSRLKVGVLTLCIDFDWTITSHDRTGGFYELPELRPYADAAIRTLYDQGWGITIHSARFNTERFSAKQRRRSLIHIAQVFEYYGLSYDKIWRDRGKPWGVFYLDDRSLPPMPSWTVAETFLSEYMKAAEEIFRIKHNVSYREAMATYRSLPRKAE